MAKVETIVTYVLLLLVLSGFAFSILPLTQAQGLTCQARIDRIEAPSRVDLGANLLVKSHLVISCTPSQLTVVARVDLTDQITGKLYSSDSISLGYIGSAPKTYNETAENSATAASSAGTWKLKISVSIYAAGTVIASASQPFEVQVGTAVTTQTTAKPTTSTTSAPRTTTTTSLTTTASGLGDNTPLIIGGVVVAVAVVASLLVFSKRKKGPAGPAAAAPPKAKAVMEPPKIKPAAPVQPAEPIISTGYAELDTMLAGGLPLGYAILVVSPPCDEKDLLFRRIIESSLSTGRPIFFLSRDLGRTQDLAARYKRTSTRSILRQTRYRAIIRTLSKSRA